MRRPFGGAAATVLVDETGFNANASVTVWTAPIGGGQITDIRTMSGGVIANGVIVADNYGVVPEFLGPDDGSDEVYLDAGLGRVLVSSNDLPDRLRVLETAVATLQAGGGGTGGGTSTSVFDGGGA